MKLVCWEYAGWKAVVTELGAPTEVFYQGDASSTFTTLIVAYYSAAPNNVIVYQNASGVAVATLLADYATATLIPGLLSVEI